MTSSYFVYAEVVVLITLNFYILSLYKKYLRKKENQEKGFIDLNSKSLFPQITPGSFMLRLPFPIFSDLKNQDIQRIIKRHNTLTYLYYFLIVFFLWHFSVFVL